MRSSSVVDRLVGWLLPVLAVVAEGALLAVVYVAVETTIDHRRPRARRRIWSTAAGSIPTWTPADSSRGWRFSAPSAGSGTPRCGASSSPATRWLPSRFIPEGG